MKHRGDNAPPSFYIEEQPNKPGYVLARFYENVSQITETKGETTYSGYEYDEYCLELMDYDGLADDIATNLAGYLDQARASAALTAVTPEAFVQQQAIINALLGGES